MNVPNCLTVLRIILSFVFVYYLLGGGAVAKVSALFVFLIASVTDYWDGEIARRSGQITQFGKLMDPIADKLLTLSAFISFVWMGLVPAWMAALIVIRDLSITVFRLLMPKSDAQAAQTGGKNKTAIQFVLILGVLVFISLRETPAWNISWTPAALRAIYWSTAAVTVLTVWTGAQYFLSVRKTVR